MLVVPTANGLLSFHQAARWKAEDEHLTKGKAVLSIIQRTRKDGREQCVGGNEEQALMGTDCPRGRWVAGSKNNQRVTKPSFSLKHSHFWDTLKLLILLAHWCLLLINEELIRRAIKGEKSKLLTEKEGGCIELNFAVTTKGVSLTVWLLVGELKPKPSAGILAFWLHILMAAAPVLHQH